MPVSSPVCSERCVKSANPYIARHNGSFSGRKFVPNNGIYKKFDLSFDYDVNTSKTIIDGKNTSK